MSRSKIEWRPVPTHNGYLVSAEGEMMGPRGYVLRPMVARGGYRYILAKPPHRPRKLFVHRAVLLAFVGRPSAGQEARHLNGITSDNRLCNLAWGDRFEQCADKRQHGTLPRGVTAASARLTPDLVRLIRSDDRPLRVIGVELGISHTAVRRAKLGMTWSDVA